VSYDLEYGTDALEMHKDSLERGARTLIVDDVIATGGTARAALDLARMQGANVLGACFLLELGFLNGREKLDGVRCLSLLTY
jgi:adenine phosphoribosyltransferase